MIRIAGFESRALTEFYGQRKWPKIPKKEDRHSLHPDQSHPCAQNFSFYPTREMKAEWKALRKTVLGLSTALGINTSLHSLPWDGPAKAERGGGGRWGRSNVTHFNADPGLPEKGIPTLLFLIYSNSEGEKKAMFLKHAFCIPGVGIPPACGE